MADAFENESIIGKLSTLWVKMIAFIQVCKNIRVECRNCIRKISRYKERIHNVFFKLREKTTEEALE